MTNPVVFAEDEASARPRPDLVFWESRNGVFFLNEEAARRDGATHQPCRCGQPIEKYKGACPKCRREKWLELPTANADDDWTLLFTYDGFHHFRGEDEAIEWGLERGIEPKNLMLVTAEPMYAERIDYEDLYSSDLPDDTNLENQCPAFAKAWDVLNEEIGHKRHILAYYPSARRVVLNLDQAIEAGGFREEV